MDCPEKMGVSKLRQQDITNVTEELSMNKTKQREEVTKIVKENEKLVDKYWNEKKTWSRQELLDFIKQNITIDDLV